MLFIYLYLLGVSGYMSLTGIIRGINDGFRRNLKAESLVYSVTDFPYLCQSK